ncbi:hypothetical protein AVO43_05630 [Microbulbifer sp. ZGT114]|nr:hypothetical protein AVO43_05630 [Microbulbifer sp. ZGT114]
MVEYSELSVHYLLCAICSICVRTSYDRGLKQHSLPKIVFNQMSQFEQVRVKPGASRAPGQVNATLLSATFTLTTLTFFFLTFFAALTFAAFTFFFLAFFAAFTFAALTLFLLVIGLMVTQHGKVVARGQIFRCKGVSIAGNTGRYVQGCRCQEGGTDSRCKR